MERNITQHTNSKGNWTIYQNDQGDWRWRLQSAYNGNILLASPQGYSNRIDCIKNAQLAGYTGT